MFEFRTDAVTLLPAQRRDDGSIVAEALITKPGVFVYADPKYPGGERRELRSDAEVYSKATMDSFANIPCTPKHPPMLLTADTAKQHMVGSTGDTVAREPIAGDQDWLKARVMVADSATIKRMDAGDNAVSCGYACVIDETPGVDPKYGRYDVVQRNIRGNHLAVGIPAGRAGRIARVRMDAELTAEERNQVAASKFAFPEERKLPIENAVHVRAAMGGEGFSAVDFSKVPGAKGRAYKKIVAAAKKLGIDSSGFEKANGGRLDDGETYVDLASSAPELVVLTTVTDGHQHTLDPEDSSGRTSYAASTDAQDASDTHNHEWVRAVDGSVTIGENAGHTHAIDPSTLGVRGDAAQHSGATSHAGRFDSRGEINMDELEKARQTIKALEAGLKAAENENGALKTRADAAESVAGQAKGALETIEKERDALKVQIAAGATAVESAALERERSRADAAEARVARFDEAMESRVDARVDLQFKATSVLGPEVNLRGMTDRQIIATTVKRLDSSADVSDAVELPYLKGRFDSLLKQRLARARQDANVSEILGTPAQQERKDSSEQRLKDYKEQYKQPLHKLIAKKGV